MATEKRLIDASPVIEKLKSHHDLFVDAWGGFGNLPEKDKSRVDEISNCIAELYNAPTIEARPVVHGRWEQGDYYDYGDVCSVCDWDSERDNCKWSSCPNCGAQMDLKGE